MGFFITILALCFVICVHELGHMFAALRSGIGVYEFSIGMGPVLFSRKYKGILYSFRLFPVGGFVKVAGLNDEEDHPAPPEISYLNKPMLSRVWVILAGPVMNLFLGFLVFFLIFFIWGTKELVPVIDKVSVNSPAQNVGLLPKDRIVSLNKKPVKDLRSDFIQPLSEMNLTPIILEVERGGEKLLFTVVPTLNQAHRPIIGVLFQPQYQQSQSFMHAFISAGRLTYVCTEMVFSSLKLLFSGSASLKDLSGPVGIIQIASSELNRGFDSFLYIMGMISISLGVINLLPFPILDGGHLLFLAIESVRKKRLSQKTELIVGNIGAAILISLMVFVVFQDILNWNHRQSSLNAIQKK